MARIPEHEIERLKREISVERLAEARGVSLSRSGDNLIGLCPFHDDREPSLVITPEKNLWHCLGACQAGGSVIDWVMKAEGISFRHAVELLRKDAIGTSGSAQKGPPPRQSLKRKLAPIAEGDAGAGELLGSVVDAYHAALKEKGEALAYLRARGLEHPELAEHFKLGLADRTLGYRLPPRYSADGADLRGRLTELGIYRKSGHEHFNGCLVVPLFDASGLPVGLYGRRIQRSLSAETPKHLYLPGPHRGVFNRQGLGGEEVIVCEALLDAMTFWCAGLRHVTSAYGVEGVTDELIEALVAAGTKRVMIAFDRDEAGDAGAEKLSVRLCELGIETFRVLFPRGMDANTYARKVAPAEKSLELAVRQAVWMRAGSAAAAPRTSQPETTPEAASAEATPEGHPSLDAEAALSEPAARAPRLPASATSPEPTSQSRGAETTSARRAAPAPALEADGDERVLVLGDRKWRARPAGKSGAGELRVNVTVSREGDRAAFFVDTLDLYAARHRSAFVKAAAAELDLDERLVLRELGQLMLALEADRAAAEKAAQAPKALGPTLTEEERAEAFALLRNPHLCERILEDLEKAGIVGERTLRVFFKWLAKTNVIPSNPAADLEMPRIEKRLPRVVFTESEVLKVLEQPDTTDILGLRDRAMMEVLYSTGIRRFELANLELYDVDAARGTLTVRQGKNRKDRVVPIGERALAWIRRYLDEARSLLVATPEHPTLFLDERGDKLNLMQLTPLMRGYIDAAKLGKSGACHVFRHTMATLMLEGGADVRHIQEILGHSQLSTTAIYTRVSIRHLKAVHDATHPAAKLAPAGGGSEATTAESARAAPLELARGGAAESDLFSSLAAEAAEELDDG